MNLTQTPKIAHLDTKKSETTLELGQKQNPKIEEGPEYKTFSSLTLLNAEYFYNYLTRGRAQSSPPSNRPKNQGLRITHGWTLKYRQLLGSRKKWGRSAQNWARTDEIKISPKMSKITISRNLLFEICYPNYFVGPSRLKGDQ